MTVETIRDGVQFVPDAADAFRRAEFEVNIKFGRNIDVNSTYRDPVKQLKMFEDWQSWIHGTGPRPAHSQAAHPRYSRHTAGLALDSDDWQYPEIVAILAENGFIRNQLNVPNEQHHFEYIISQDRNYGQPMLTAEEIANAVWNYKMHGGSALSGGENVPTETAGERIRNIRRSTFRARARDIDTNETLRKLVTDGKVTEEQVEAIIEALI